MTSTTTPLPATSPRKRLPLVLITNVCVAVILLAAIPVINKGQQGFAPHAVVNKEYINSAINSGEAEFMNRALNITMIKRPVRQSEFLYILDLLILRVKVCVHLENFHFAQRGIQLSYHRSFPGYRLNITNFEGI